MPPQTTITIPDNDDSDHKREKKAPGWLAPSADMPRLPITDLDTLPTIDGFMLVLPKGSRVELPQKLPEQVHAAILFRML